MGWRGTVVLAVLVAAAASVFLLSPRPPEQLSDSTLLGEPRFVHDTTPAPQLLSGMVAADVEKLTLGYGDEVVTVARLGSGWRGAADARNLDDFLEGLQRATLISSVEPGAPLSDFGLDAPSRRIFLETNSDRRFLLFIGDRNPAGTSVYVRVGEGPVSIAGALVLWEFDKAFAAITGRKGPL